MTLVLFILVGALLGAAVWTFGVVRENRRRQRAIDRQELAEWAGFPQGNRLSSSRRQAPRDPDGGRP